MRTRSYAAIGMPMMDLDIARAVEDIKAGRTPPSPATLQVGPTGSPATRKLVEAHQKVLEQNAGMAFFGL